MNRKNNFPDKDVDPPLFEIEGLFFYKQFPSFITDYTSLSIDEGEPRHLSRKTIHSMDRLLGRIAMDSLEVITDESQEYFDFYSHAPRIIRYLLASMFDLNRDDIEESGWYFNQEIQNLSQRLIEGLTTDALREEAGQDERVKAIRLLVEIAQRANNAVAHVHEHNPDLIKQVASKELKWPVNMELRPAERKKVITYVEETRLASGIRKSPRSAGPVYDAPVTRLTRDLLEYIHDFRASEPAVYSRDHEQARFGDYIKTKFADAYPFSEALGRQLWDLPTLKQNTRKPWRDACVAVIKEFKDNILGYTDILAEVGRSAVQEYRRDYPNASESVLNNRRLNALGKAVEKALVGLINDGLGGK